MTVSYTVSEETMAMIVQIINQNTQSALPKDCAALIALRGDLICAGYLRCSGPPGYSLVKPDVPDITPEQAGLFVAIKRAVQVARDTLGSNDIIGCSNSLQAVRLRTMELATTVLTDIQNAPQQPVNPVLRCPNDPATCDGCVDCSCFN